jgi:aminopeptidase N
MQWDEDKYGLEYDLANMNVVATSDFNMGAMENKGMIMCANYSREQIVGS